MKKNIISILLTVLVLILFGIYLYRNPQILISIQEINLLYLIIISVLFLIIFFIEGLFIKLTLHAFDKNIDTKESYFLSTVSRIGNYLLPMRAGAVFRAMYLKKIYKFEYSKFLSTLYAYYILLFLIYSILALLALGIKYIDTEIYFPIVTLFFVLLFIGTLLVIVFRKFEVKNISENKYIQKILTVLNKFISSWDNIVKRKDIFINLILLTTGNILINWVIYIVEFHSLNLNINILDTLLYTCLSGVSLLISITPGSLGLREAVFLFTSESIGLTEEQIMQLAFLDRGVMYVLLLVLLVLITIFVKRFKLKDIFFVKETT
jgi:uncharacterized protein (TIRG00374 family)